MRTGFELHVNHVRPSAKVYPRSCLRNHFTSRETVGVNADVVMAGTLTDCKWIGNWFNHEVFSPKHKVHGAANRGTFFRSKEGDAR